MLLWIINLVVCHTESHEISSLLDIVHATTRRSKQITAHTETPKQKQPSKGHVKKSLDEIAI